MSSFSVLLLELLPTSALDAEFMSLAMRQLAGRSRGCRTSGMIWQGGGGRAPTRVLGPWRVPPVEVSGSSDELVAASVMMVASQSGTPAA